MDRFWVQTCISLWKIYQNDYFFYSEHAECELKVSWLNEKTIQFRYQILGGEWRGILLVFL